MEIKNKILCKYFNKDVKAAPLAVFRIFFGLLMFLSILRFYANGWIEKLYLEPSFHFKYEGFEFVQVPGNWTYLLFIACGLSALFVSIGYKYRLSIIIFFLSFTYIELMDKTTYLNHYYFISILSFLLIWLPAHAYFSVDAYYNSAVRSEFVKKWHIDAIKALIAIVYIYAGLAKVNYDWLFNAMPLAIWLPSKSHIPLIGELLTEKWVIYAFSWIGMIYDLIIVFLLLNKKTRIFGFSLVVIFHVLTRILFPIGMFPFIMIFSALIFFDAKFHERIINFISRIFNLQISFFRNSKIYQSKYNNIALACVSIFIFIQIILPLRNFQYDENIYWVERGYRFSWRVMLMEKAGMAQFQIYDVNKGTKIEIDNSKYLTAFQEKQMATQPDFILQYADFLGDEYRKNGYKDIEVKVQSFVSLNGRGSQKYIDSEVDLLSVSYKELCENHITPLDEI